MPGFQSVIDMACVGIMWFGLPWSFIQFRYPCSGEPFENVKNSYIWKRSNHNIITFVKVRVRCFEWNFTVTFRNSTHFKNLLSNSSYGFLTHGIPHPNKWLLNRAADTFSITGILWQRFESPKALIGLLSSTTTQHHLQSLSSPPPPHIINFQPVLEYLLRNSRLANGKACAKIWSEHVYFDNSVKFIYQSICYIAMQPSR